MADRYLNLGRIAQTRYAEVFRAVDTKFSKVVAVKKIKFADVDNGFPFEIMLEISMLRELIHPNVVRLFKVERQDADSCSLIFENAMKDLSVFIREHSNSGFSSLMTKKLLAQILKGLTYCHSRKVMHRDLKPRNILIDAEGIVKLADFGLARSFDVPVEGYSSIVATLPYRAPEVLLGLPHTHSVDIWAVGCIFAEIVALKPLFNGISEASIMEHIVSIFGLPTDQDWPGAAPICRDKYNIQEPKSTKDIETLLPNLQRDALDLLKKMMCLNPTKRITAGNALLHPYFRKFKVTPDNLLEEDFHDVNGKFVKF